MVQCCSSQRPTIQSLGDLNPAKAQESQASLEGLFPQRFQWWTSFLLATEHPAGMLLLHLGDAWCHGDEQQCEPSWIQSTSLEPWEGPALCCKVCCVTSSMYADTQAYPGTFRAGGIAPILLMGRGAESSSYSGMIPFSVLCYPLAKTSLCSLPCLGWSQWCSASRKEDSISWDMVQHTLLIYHFSKQPSQEFRWQHNGWLQKRVLMGPSES